MKLQIWIGSIVLVALMAALVFLVANVGARDRAEQCEKAALTIAAALYREAAQETDPEMARHLSTLGDSTISSIELECRK